MSIKNYYIDTFSIDYPTRLPVVQICKELNPYSGAGVILYAVLGYHLPYGTMKFLAVYGLLGDALRNGRMPRDCTIVLATSGAAGHVAVQVATAAPFNAARVVLVMKKDVPLAKRFAPQLAGAEICEPPADKSTIAYARELGAQKGWLNLDQYADPASADLYYEWAGPRILQTTPTLNAFCTPVGTGGTLIGLSKAFRAYYGAKNVTMVGVMCEKEHDIPGMRDLGGMKEIKLPWRKAADKLIFVKTHPSYLAAAWCQWMMKVTPGLSSGATIAGAYAFIDQRKKAGTLDMLRNKDDGKIRIGILFHDSNGPYLVDRFPVILSGERGELSPHTAPKAWAFLAGS